MTSDAYEDDILIEGKNRGFVVVFFVMLRVVMILSKQSNKANKKQN